MINSVIFDNEIKIWWEYVGLKNDAKFRIKLNSKKVFYTRDYHFNLLDLTQDTVYKVEVDCVDNGDNSLFEIGHSDFRTKKSKIRIDVTKPPYNAVGDGTTDNTVSLQKALNDCTEKTCVYIPDGIYLSGALDIHSDTELVLSDGAVIKGSTDENDYLPLCKSRFEGTETLCYRSLINVGRLDSSGPVNCKNVVIRGGKIWGGGQELRKNIINANKDRFLAKYGYKDSVCPPLFYASVLPGRYRGRLLNCNNTDNVVIANCDLGNSPGWNVHFVYCSNIVTCGCTISSHGVSNGDGWNPDSSTDCTIFDTKFDTGDDCVAIKSGKNLEGYLIARPSERINVFDCTSIDGHGISIGSEMSGGIRAVRVWNCVMNAGFGFTVKFSEKRGGFIEDVKVSACKFLTLAVTAYYGNDDGESAPVLPKISNITFEDIELYGYSRFTGDANRVEPENVVSIVGFNEDNTINDVTLKNITFKYRSMMPNQYLDIRHVKNLRLENIVSLGEI